MFWTLADDHFIPLNAMECPGTVIENMLPACHAMKSGGGSLDCNRSKSDNNPHQWLIERFGKRKAAKIEKAIDAYFQIAHEKFSMA